MHGTVSREQYFAVRKKTCLEANTEHSVSNSNVVYLNRLMELHPAPP